MPAYLRSSNPLPNSLGLIGKFNAVKPLKLDKFDSPLAPSPPAKLDT